MSFLDRILPAKEAEVKALQATFAARTPRRTADQPVRDFAAALQGGNRIIAEIKHKSPSHPAFVQHAAPATLARAYRRNGAAALSIVVDQANFGTSLADVSTVKAAVDLPVLVKDFVIDEAQLTAAWAAGADAALLIVRMLDSDRLDQLLRHARRLGLHVLVECHDEADIELALAAKARLIGVNNRNLATLTTELDHGARLLPRVNRPALRISESGLYTRNDVTRMAESGADAFLIGHALLQSRDPGRQVAELCGRETAGRPRVKLCGITSVADARLAHEAGADLLGLIMAPGARQVAPGEAMAIRQKLPAARLCGVFVDAEIRQVTDLAAACDLDLIQLHGQESPAYCQELAVACGRPLIKALTVTEATPERAAAYAAAAYFLVDLPKGPERGALTPDDCRTAAGKLAQAGHDVLLAGGLNPANVRRGDNRIFFAVDVASGVEAGPGVKDPDLIRTFITEAKR